jgi:Na+/proline symporter
MNLGILDWSVIGIYVAATLALGLVFARRASGGVEDFFLAGRRLPWYLVGTSMVATTLAADTPLAVVELVREGGLAGAWYGWSAAIGSVTAAIFFAKLWRRSRVVTDAELIELRYAGTSARVLRTVRALYLSLVVNCLVLGWVIFAMVKIVGVVMGLPEHIVLPVLIVVAVAYSTASGFWGVVATDAMQFVVAVIGSVTLAVVAVGEAGGTSEMVATLSRTPGVLDLFPAADSAQLPLLTFGVYLSMQWWATRNADGGEYLGQRLFAARSAADAQFGMLWFVACEYVVKLWPLIIVGLASLVLYPELAEHQDAYPRMIADYLPAGLRGLLVASLLAAFMSTVDTHLSWGSSYLINDLYKRFIRKDASDRHYVAASRWAMLVMAGLAGLTSLALTSVADTWKLLLALGAGQGLVVLLRWYWWRINAISELAAMVASAIATVIVLRLWPESGDYGTRLIAIVAVSTAAWLIATFATRPVPTETLQRFYDRAQPRGGWWGPVVTRKGGRGLGPELIAWICGLVFVYGATLGVGELILGDLALGLAGIGAGALAGVVTIRVLRGEERPE